MVTMATAALTFFHSKWTISASSSSSSSSYYYFSFLSFPWNEKAKQCRKTYTALLLNSNLFNLTDKRFCLWVCVCSIIIIATKYTTIFHVWVPNKWPCSSSFLCHSSAETKDPTILMLCITIIARFLRIIIFFSVLGSFYFVSLYISYYLLIVILRLIFIENNTISLPFSVPCAIRWCVLSLLLLLFCCLFFLAVVIK